MPVHPEAVRALFWDGDDGQRVSALGLMQGRIDLADVGAVVEAIADPRSAFEQYHGLKLAMALAGLQTTRSTTGTRCCCSERYERHSKAPGSGCSIRNAGNWPVGLIANLTPT